MLYNDAKKILKLSSLGIFFALIVIYAFFGSRNLIFGVKIKNINIDGKTIENGSTIKKGSVVISGNAKNAINLSLNGREISIDQNGNFNETIALPLGYNIITLRARDKFDYTDEKDYQLIYKEE